MDGMMKHERGFSKGAHGANVYHQCWLTEDEFRGSSLGNRDIGSHNAPVYIVSPFGSERNSCEVRQLRELFWLSGASKVGERKECKNG